MTFALPQVLPTTSFPRALMGDFYVTRGFALPRMVPTVRLSRVLMRGARVVRWVS